MALRFDREIVEIDAAEHNSRIGGSGYKADVPVHAGVEAHAFGGGGIGDGGLKHLQGKL
jgi:hypothetical protein